MATYSNIGIKLVTTGDESGTWGDTTNTNFSDILDEAIAGAVTYNISSDADVTLTVSDGSSSDARHAVILFTSTTLSATRTVTFAPDTLQKTWLVINSTTGGQSLTFKQGSAGTTVTVPNGESAIIYSDGAGATNGAITKALDSFTNTKITTGTLNATTLDLTNLEVTNVKAKDGTAALTIADSTGKVTVSTELAVDNLNLSGNAITSTNSNGNIDLTPNGTGEVNITKVDIDAGTIDGTTIATSDITVGAGKTLDVSAGTLTLANDQISGDKIEGGTINAITINTLTSTTVNGTTFDTNVADAGVTLSGVTLSADGTNTNIDINITPKGTGEVNLTKVDIDGGAIDGTAIGVNSASTGAFTTLITSSGSTLNGGVVVNETGADVDFRIESDTNANAFFLDGANGNVGIGTSSPGAKLSVDGSAIFNDSGADVDFRVEGDTDANLLFVDASTDRIGVGKNNPSTKFDVNGTVTATAFAGPINGTVGATTPSTGVFTTLTADYIYASNIVNVGSFTWDSGTSSPAAAISVGSQVITPIHTGMRRCVINDSGVVQYYLNPADSTEKLDGTAANLDGTDGQVMVEIPRFYTKFEANGTYRTWSISPVELPGYTVHPAFVKDGVDVDFRYIGAYDACVYDVTATDYISGLNWDNNDGGNGVGVDVTATTGDKLASVSGVYPMVGLTRAEFRTIAANRGAGWRQLDYTLWSAIQLLYLIEYQSFYSQNILGAGNTGTTYATSSGTQSDNGASEAGKSNSIGNASTNTTNGASSASRQVAWMSYRGIENFYGNDWNWVDGVIVNAAGTVSADSATWHYTNNSADYSDSVSTNMTLITSSGQTNFDYPDALASVNNFFISTSGGGSSATYTTDNWYGSTSADRGVLVGGHANLGAGAGAFHVNANDASSNAFRFFGGRLAF